MATDFEELLVRMRNEATPALVDVENQLWREIHRRRARDRIMRVIGRNTCIAAAGLAIGIAVAVTRPAAPPKSVNITLLLTEVPPASLLE